MKMKKVLALVLAAAAALSLAACGGKGNTENYPAKDLEIVIPYKVGGTTDLAVRGVLDAIPSSVLDKNITVTNTVGGSGLIGTEEFLSHDADGYTLGLLNCDLVLNYVSGATDINPTERMIPLAAVEQDPYLLLGSKNASFSTFAQFLEQANANPDTLVVGVTGVGTVPNLLGAILLNAGVAVKVVPYDSAPDAIAAVLANEADICISAMAPAIGQIDSGDLVPLAVTSADRSQASPDVPTMAEVSDLFKDVNLLSWIMIALPAGVDDSVVTYWKNALADAVASDTYAATRESFYFEPITITTDQLSDFVAEQSEYYKTLIA